MADLKKLFGTPVRTKPDSFEVALGVVCLEWIALIGLDNVIEGLDEFVSALEIRRDLEFNQKK